MTGLADQAFVVTGAANGIGRATAERLASEGASIVAVDLPSELTAASRAPWPAEMSAKVIEVPADVTDPDAMETVMERALASLGRLDGLAHLAAISRDSMHWDMGLEDFTEVLRVNLTGTFVTAKAASRILREQGSGSIVLTASRIHLGNAGQASYTASKGGVVSLTRTLALELGGSGVRVNAVAPGFIESRMTAVHPPEVRERAISAAPLGRTGTPHDVASVIRFLLSAEASFMTGQVLYVDGGRSVTTSPV